MNEDRNKTDLTKDVTAAACRWLDERGAKPVETEVPVAQGWLADLAAVLSPTQTELQDLKLVRRKPPWKSGRETIDAWYAEANAAGRLYTALVEVKTSRSDFAGDKKWNLTPPTNLAYLAIPNDLPVRRDEMPARWGLLLYSAASGCVRQTIVPAVREVSCEQQLDTVLEIAIRRDHHTRYERLRSFQREMRVQKSQEVTRTRVRDAMRAVLAITQGRFESVEGVLDRYQIKGITGWELDELRELWPVPADATAFPVAASTSDGAEKK